MQRSKDKQQQEHVAASRTNIQTQKTISNY